jgi:SsrA-binding protein
MPPYVRSSSVAHGKFKNGHVKVALGLAKGKQTPDKRDTIKRREADRETRAAVRERRR